MQTKLKTGQPRYRAARSLFGAWPASLLCTSGLLADLASACTPPEPPYLPSDVEEMSLYADLLRTDFETYLGEVQAYFLCVDDERAQVFAEAQAVARDYATFVAALE